MRRFPWLVGFGVWGTLALGGCTPTGSYQLSWNFFANADGTGGTESAYEACGKHGVDAILLTGTSNGAGATRVALCTPGQATGIVAPGTWTFQIETIDVRGTVLGTIDAGGTVIPGAVSTATMTVSQDMPTVFPAVTLTPRPECSDGIDNDGDGLVDGDDPGCANATATTKESTPGAATPDGGAPDGSAPDGANTDGAGQDGPAADGPPMDGLPTDGLAPEAGPIEGGTSEAGTPDAGTPDGGTLDGGTPDDGGSDAPAPDDGGSDAPAPDDAAAGG